MGLAGIAKARFPAMGAASPQWWLFHTAHGAFAARGVHGPTIYVGPTAEMVLVRFASFPKAQNGFIDPTSPPTCQAVAEFLLTSLYPPARVPA